MNSPPGHFILEWYYIPLLDMKEPWRACLLSTTISLTGGKRRAEIKQLMEDSQKKAKPCPKVQACFKTGLSRMANGDLTFRRQISKDDPLVHLKKDYNTAVDSIKNVIEEIGKPPNSWKSRRRIPARARRRSPNLPNR